MAAASGAMLSGAGEVAKQLPGIQRAVAGRPAEFGVADSPCR